VSDAAARSHWRGSALVAIAAMGWGTWPFFLRHAEALSPIPPALEAAASMLALTLLSGLLVSRDRVRVRATPRDWAKLVVLGVSDALNVVFFFAAYQRTSVAIAVLTHYLTPTLVALAAPLALGEPWKARTMAAVGVSSLGLVLLLEPWSAARHAGDFVGAALGCASAVCYAANVLVNKRLVPVFSGSEMALYHGFVALPLLLLIAPAGASAHVAPAAALWLAAGALLPGAVCGLLFVWGLRRVQASHAANLTLFEPLVATVGASLALHEGLGAPSIVGGALIFTGAAMAVTAEVRGAP
jgi:drug/metabolite transporter (DMT)-like permease